MKAPLPEIPLPSPKNRAPKPPFFGLSVVCALDALFVVVSCTISALFVKEQEDVSAVVMQALTLLILPLALAHLYFLWRGANWARWLFILATLAVMPWDWISPSPPMTSLPDIERTLNWLGSALSIGITIWLLLPGVARHFTQKAVK